MSGPCYGSWNWTLINVNVWHYLLTQKPLGVNELQKVNEEKDIGIVTDSSLKF